MNDALLKAMGQEWRRALRGSLLELLHASDRFTCETVLLKATLNAAQTMATREQVEAELVWLEGMGMVSCRREGGDGAILSATLQERGQELIETQREFPGIRRPSAPR